MSDDKPKALISPEDRAAIEELKKTFGVVTDAECIREALARCRSALDRGEIT